MKLKSPETLHKELADIMIMDSNPSLNILNTNTIRYVVKNGRLYYGNTLDEVLPYATEIGCR